MRKKTTGLTEIHKELGARMVGFAGYFMPLSYEGIKEEHVNVRENVGVFDVSHMGEFIVKGKEALDLVQKVTTNDASKLDIGQAQYSCLPNDRGGIVDDLIVYRLPEDELEDGEMKFMLVVNAANEDKDWEWINEHNDFEAELENISNDYGLLAIQGPKATEALQSLTKVKLDEIEYYHYEIGELAGIKDVIISATGYTGSGGFELYINNKNLKSLWNAIFEAGEEHGIKPAGLGARDTLRMEMGYCLYGNDITDMTSPIEAGLGWITKVKKGDFISRDTFKKQKKEGVDRKLVGFVPEDRRVPRNGYLIQNADEEGIGHVTSGTQSPSLGHPIGMGYVKSEFAEPDTEILINTGRKKIAAKVVKMPFYKK